jgi:hypothetical protein
MLNVSFLLHKTRYCGNKQGDNHGWTQINTDSEGWTRVLLRLTLGHCPVNGLPVQGEVASY